MIELDYLNAETNSFFEEYWTMQDTEWRIQTAIYRDPDSKVIVAGIRGFIPSSENTKEEFIIDYALTRPECRRKQYMERLLVSLKQRFSSVSVLATEDAIPYWIKQGFTQTCEDKSSRFNDFSDTILLSFLSKR